MSDKSKQEIALEIMRKPFPPNQISTMCRPTKKDNPPANCKACGGYHKMPAVQLSYVGHAALTDRLLDADPSWTWEPLALAADGTPLLDKDGGMWIKLTVAGVTRLGYGDAQGKTGGDATKERIGDALRNAAMRFGAALELWHKGELHVEEEDKPANGNGKAEVSQIPGANQRVMADATECIDEIMRCETLGSKESKDGLYGAYAAAYTKARAVHDIAAMKAVSEAYQLRKKQLEAGAQ